MMIRSESPTTSDNNTMDDQHTYNGNHHENYDDNDNMKDPLRRFSFDSKDDDDDENESEHGNTTAMSMLMNYYGTEKIDPLEQETKSPAELIKSVRFKPDAYVKELLDTKQVHELIKHDAQMLVCMFILYIYRMYIVCISYVYRMYTYSYDNSQRTQIYISVYT